MNTGDRIKQRRIALGLTVDELAEKIGKSRATIYRYENGDTVLIDMIREGDEKAVQFLVDNDADLMMTDSKGLTPLEICKQVKNEEIALYIYQKGVEKEREKERKKKRYLSQERVK